MILSSLHLIYAWPAKNYVQKVKTREIADRFFK